jgi:hypothetical protein
MVHGVKPHATRSELMGLLSRLPAGTTGEYDEDVAAVVITVPPNADDMNAVLGILGESGLVSFRPGTEEAILRYLPDRASQPAYWDVLDPDWAICTTCDWSAEAANFEALEAEMRRHTARVHGGRSVD